MGTPETLDMQTYLLHFLSILGCYPEKKRHVASEVCRPRPSYGASTVTRTRSSSLLSTATSSLSSSLVPIDSFSEGGEGEREA